MCTAVNETLFHHLFGRTFDFEKSYGEKTVITPRRFNFKYTHDGTSNKGFAIIGTAYVCDNIPLYYDAVNEHGLCIAALNFPLYSNYFPAQTKKCNVTSFEVIPWILRQHSNVSSALKALKDVNITADAFSADILPTPLHWLIADKNSAITVESVKSGLKIYHNPFGILTNSPPFPYHEANITNYMYLSSNTPQNFLCPKIELTPYSRGSGSFGLPGDFSSPSRFIRSFFAKSKTHHTNTITNEIGRFFHIMETVSIPCGCVESETQEPVSTIYTSCADPQNGIYYYTTYNCRNIRSVHMFNYPLDGDTLIEFSMNV